MEWIKFSEQRPETHFDFQTMMETQFISKKVRVRFSDEANRKTAEHFKVDISQIDTEKDCYFVLRSVLGNPQQMGWSFSETGTDNYRKHDDSIEYWRYAE